MKNEKQTYIAPELTELGNVQDLTQGGAQNVIADSGAVSI